MIRWSAVWAMVVRYVHVWRRDINLLLMALYWPLLDIIMWGFLGLWIQQITSFQCYEVLALLGILLWQIIGRGCNIMMAAFVEEIWSHNVVNLFSLPIKITEWIAGVLLFFTIMMGISSLYCMIVMILLYDVSFWYLCTMCLIFAPPLFFSAIWIGFTALIVIILFGKRGIELGFVMIWALLPFSGAYYPVEVLPAWGRAISSLLPMHYVFQGMREYVMYQHNPTLYLTAGYAVSIVYAASAIILFIYCFNYSKRKGLARLTD